MCPVPKGVLASGKGQIFLHKPPEQISFFNQVARASTDKYSSRRHIVNVVIPSPTPDADVLPYSADRKNVNLFCLGTPRRASYVPHVAPCRVTLGRED